MAWIREKVEAGVKKVLEENLNVDPKEIRDDSSFADDLGADSLDAVEIAMALESEFRIEIPDEKAEKIETFRQAVDTVCKILGVTE
jgi:acyl carrier protein